MYANPSLTAQKWTARVLALKGSALRLLVVDDNVNAADALAAYLSSEDIFCRAAYGGREAIRSAVSWDPHLILMDISMPECNGFEASLKVRQDARTAQVAMIAHTALDQTEIRRHLSEDLFDGYCQKGQPLEKLLALVRSFLP